MSEQSLLSRIGNWFKQAGVHREGNGTTPEFIVNNEDGNLAETQATLDAAPSGGIEPRSTFLRPWAKRDAAIENLQGGINAIGELMTGIRDHLEQQSKR